MRTYIAVALALALFLNGVMAVEVERKHRHHHRRVCIFCTCVLLAVSYMGKIIILRANAEARREGHWDFDLATYTKSI